MHVLLIRTMSDLADVARMETGTAVFYVLDFGVGNTQ